MSEGGRRRAWQRMLSGRRLDLIDPSPLDVEIGDIAHGLARVARWNGQTKGPEIFSVAQHSLLVEALFAASLASPSGKARLTALLHDAPEYVIGDMISPFKAAIGGDYRLIEERLKRAIHIRFGLPRRAAGRTQPLDQDRRPRLGLSRGDRARRLLDRGGAQTVRRARPAAPRLCRVSRADAPGAPSKHASSPGSPNSTPRPPGHYKVAAEENAVCRAFMSARSP